MVDLTERIARYKNDVLPTAWMQAEYGGKIWGGMPTSCRAGSCTTARSSSGSASSRPARHLGRLHRRGSGDEEGRRLDPARQRPGRHVGTNHWTMFLNSRRGNIFTPEGKVIRNNDAAKQMFRWYFDIQDIAFQTPVNDLRPGSPCRASWRPTP